MARCRGRGLARSIVRYRPEAAVVGSCGDKLGEPTCRLVRDAVHVEAVESLELNGKRGA
jgi:hypothetical protein